MGDHILPQVLLRGFSINNPFKKEDYKIMILTPEKTIQDKIRFQYQEENFYSRETEHLLDKKFENNFGRIKKKIVDELLNTEVDTFRLKKDDFYELILFFVTMWRRNDVQIEKTMTVSKFFLNNPILRSKMLPMYQQMSTEDLIKLNINEVKRQLYDNIINMTNRNDPTVIKTYRDYIPVVLINKTDILFPLHNKYATVHYIFKTKDEEYPDFTMEPITNRIMMLFVKKINHGSDDDIKKIKVIRVNSSEEIKLIINLYIIDSVKSVVVDKSCIDIVEKRLRDPLANSINRLDYRLFDLLLKIGVLV